jgi:hypothetical protein
LKNYLQFFLQLIYQNWRNWEWIVQDMGCLVIKFVECMFEIKENIQRKEKLMSSLDMQDGK